MAITVYPWVRFWCPPTAHLDQSDGGFVSDPESEYGRIANRELFAFNEITEKRCLVLLGEPGIGKTEAIRAEFDQQSRAVVGGDFDRIDLRAFGDERRLVDRLFDSPTARRWKAGTGSMHLFLDSLDECLLRIDTIAALLPDELRQLPINRLYIRIACRTAAWPSLLETELKKLWRQDDQFGVYELVPLRRRDVELAAQTSAIDPRAFCRDLDRAGAVPLAIKPVTLSMLLTEYAAGGGLEPDRWSLYERGCGRMAAELNESRVSARRVGKLTGEQRLAVASRIAAATLVANRYAVWIAPDLTDKPPEDLQVSELFGGTEKAHGDSLPIGRQEVEEALDTGLFSSRGASRLGWAHQTYAEFLAARYIVQHELPLPQVRSLIRHPAGKLVPQLHELSAWIATNRADVFDEILSYDPEVLLRSDVASTDDATRARLVDALLSAFDAERLHDMLHDLVRHYAKLKHPDLARQLRPYILDRQKGLIVRRSAVLIAKECRESALSAELLSVALDENDDEHIRSFAILAMGECADDVTKAELKPLVTNPSPSDVNDEIKGCALNLLWPKHLTATELFAVLTPSRDDALFGTYRSFISTSVARYVNAADLVIALDWVVKLEAGPAPAAFSRNFEMAALADQIVLNAIGHLNDPAVQSALARAMMQRLRAFYRQAYPDHAKRFDSLIGQDARGRHLLIEALVSMLNADRRDAILLAPVLLHEDVAWLVEQALKYSADDAHARKFALLAETALRDVADTGTFERIYFACQESPVIAEQFAWLLNPVELDSQLAAELRKHHRDGQSSKESPPELDPPPARRIIECLDRLEAGQLEAWWQLNYWILFGLQRQEVGELNSDLTETPGWKSADGPLRQRLIRGAEAYVRSADPDNQRWFGTDNLHRPALAGYRALQLLHKENPSLLATIEPVHWSRWAAIVLCYPTHSDDTHIQQELVAAAYARAPQEILATWRGVLQRAVARSEPSWIRSELTKLALCQTDEALRALLLGLVDELLFTPEQTGPVLADILKRRVLDVGDFAERFLKSPPPTEETSRKKVLIAAREILLAGQRGALPAIWPAVRADASFGETLFLELVQHGIVPLASGGIFSTFSDAELAELFLWLENRFPRASDPDHRGIAHAMGPRESMSQFRDAILQILQARGTPDAVRELQRIKLAFPQYDWLYTVVLNAQTEMLRKTWTPPTPTEILTLVRASENRLISTPDQLLEILFESLERLQLEDLKGETGRAKFLWNETSKGKFQPKDEPSLSDYIKGFLQRDLKDRGIIVNREVEVFRPAGAGKGPATDIHVDVIPRNQKNPLHLKAVIEVKGCWHPELKTALQAQLVEKYLRGPECRHGIYLVGWFDPDQWDAEDYRKKDAPRLTLAEMREFFERQAAASSTSEGIIRSVVLDCSH